jgi:hypothetical protein
MCSVATIPTPKQMTDAPATSARVVTTPPSSVPAGPRRSSRDVHVDRDRIRVTRGSVPMEPEGPVKWRSEVRGPFSHRQIVSQRPGVGDDRDGLRPGDLGHRIFDILNQ